MYSSRKIGLALVAIVIAAGGLASAAELGSFGYGRAAAPAQIAGWDIDVRGEDGAGLPPGKGTVGKISMDQVRKIAAVKLVDMNANDIDAAVAMLVGSARSMGLEVVGQ